MPIIVIIIIYINMYIYAFNRSYYPMGGDIFVNMLDWL